MLECYKAIKKRWHLGSKMMIIFLSDNKQAVIAVLESNSELIKDALPELDEVSNAFLFFIWEWLF